MPTRKEIGYAGEDAVCRYLTERGFAVVARNFVSGHEEIDIIAQNEKYIVFCEVKTRKESTDQRHYGRPARAVNAAKRAHLLACATEYLRAKYGSAQPPELQPRLDVAEVWYREEKGEMTFRIRYIERAFGAEKRSYGGEKYEAF